MIPILLIPFLFWISHSLGSSHFQSDPSLYHFPQTSSFFQVPFLSYMFTFCYFLSFVLAMANLGDELGNIIEISSGDDIRDISYYTGVIDPEILNITLFMVVYPLQTLLLLVIFLHIVRVPS